MPRNSAARRCTAHRSTGKPCIAWAVRGATVCVVHGGATPQVKRLAAVRAEVQAWGLGAAHVDPGEMLLRLVTTSAIRVQRYAEELERQVEAAGTLQSALIGKITVIDVDGKTRIGGEYVRALVRLEAEERDRLANFSAKAIAAGLAERQVRVAERQGSLLAELLRQVIGDPTLGLSDDQRAAFPNAIRRHLALLAPPPVPS